ncbi:hypothetical protein KBD69_05175 [Candidatus Woesebacteria bacterium]|nr:hypothetical protein [Candidatus Woesebacteria bacterium]
MTSTTGLSTQAKEYLSRGSNDPEKAWSVISLGRNQFDILLYRYAAAALADPTLFFSQEGLNQRYNDPDSDWHKEFHVAFKQLKEKGYLVPQEEPRLLGFFKLEPGLFNALATGIRATLEHAGETIEPTRSRWDEPTLVPAFTRYAQELGGGQLEYIVQTK